MLGPLLDIKELKGNRLCFGGGGVSLVRVCERGLEKL
jgi:hypothetical protein